MTEAKPPFKMRNVLRVIAGAIVIIVLLVITKPDAEQHAHKIARIISDDMARQLKVPPSLMDPDAAFPAIYIDQKYEDHLFYSTSEFGREEPKIRTVGFLGLVFKQ